MKKENDYLFNLHLNLKQNWPFLILKCLISVLFCFLNSSIHAQEQSTLKGIVKSEKGEVLNAVTIEVKSSNIIGQTNNNGEYLLKNVPINVSVNFSRIGFKSLSMDLKLLPDRENTLNVVLLTNVQSLNEINITERLNSTNFSLIDPAKFSTFPQSSGNFESFLKTLPGVSGNNELSSQYSVRGGNFDENLIYLNDIEIYRPLLIRSGQQEGLSFVNPALSSNIYFSAGGFEARYGDKLSSVLDIRYDKPDSLSIESQIGLLLNTASLKWPLKNGFLLAGLRHKNNQNLLERQNLEGEYYSQFSDYQLFIKKNINPLFNISFQGLLNKGRVNIEPNRKVTEFGTSDEVLNLFVDYNGKESNSYESINTALTLSYNLTNTTNLKWINSWAIIKEHENSDLLGWYSFLERNSGGINSVFSGKLLGSGTNYNFYDNNLKSSFINSELRLNKQLNKSFFEMGLRLQSDQIQEDLDEKSAVDTTGFSKANSGNWLYRDLISQQNQLKIFRINGFIQNTFAFNPKFSLALGARFNYNNFSNENLISPRFSFLYNPNKNGNLQLKLSAGSYNQSPYYREIKNYNATLNLDAKSQRSFQIISGLDYRFDGLGTRLKFSSELYYKFLRRLTPYKIEDLRLRYLSDQRSKGYALGADFSLTGNFAKDLQSTFRLSILKTEEDIFNDIYFSNNPLANSVGPSPGYLRRPNDQLLNIGMMFQDRLVQNPTYKVHLNLIYSSSLPIGPPGPQRHTERFKIPAYKRVDIGFSKDFADPESRRASAFFINNFQSLSLHVELFNLFNFKNTASYLWLNDKNSNQYAVPNYLTSRMLNFKIICKLKTQQ